MSSLCKLCRQIFLEHTIQPEGGVLEEGTIERVLEIGKGVTTREPAKSCRVTARSLGTKYSPVPYTLI